jgi:hypothetical protein
VTQRNHFVSSPTAREQLEMTNQHHNNEEQFNPVSSTTQHSSFYEQPPPNVQGDAFELDPWLISRSPEFEELFKFIDDQLRMAVPKQRYHEGRAKNLRMLLANLFVADYREPGKPIKYYRRTESYTKTSLYRQDFMSAKVLKEMIDALKVLEFVTTKVGHKDFVGNSSTMSVVGATDQFVELCSSVGLRREMFKRSPDRPLVILKSKKGKDKRRTKIEYKLTPEIEEMKNTIRSYNSFLDQFELGLPEDIKEKARDKQRKYE